MERKRDLSPTISEIIAVVSTDEDVRIGFGKPDFSVSRDMFMLSLGVLRSALPENYGMSIAQEITDAFDETPKLDASKLSPELATLAIAFSEYARLVGDRQFPMKASSTQRMEGLTSDDIAKGPNENTLSYKEAAEYLKVHPKTVYRYMKLGKLHPQKLGGKGRPRFSTEELNLLMQ